MIIVSSNVNTVLFVKTKKLPGLKLITGLPIYGIIVIIIITGDIGDRVSGWE